MARKKQQQQQQGADVSKEQQAEILAQAVLSAELRAQAEAQGTPMGRFATYRMENQQAQCDAAIALLGLGHEKYVGNVTPAQENYLSAVVASAWAVAYPGVTLKISEDRTLANFQSQARNICKAGSLSGWLKSDVFRGGTLNTRETLHTMLGKRLNAKDNVESKGFHAAAAQAYRFIVMAQNQVQKGDLKLSQVSVGALTKKETKKGRPAQAMSKERIDQFLDKLKLSSPAEVVRVIDDAVHTLAGAVPLESKDPLVKSKLHAAHDWILREGIAFAKKARTVYQDALKSMQSPSMDKDAKGASLEQLAMIDAAGMKSGKIGPMQTPAQHDAPKLDAEHRIIEDQVSKRARKPRSKKQVADVEAGQIKAA